MCVTSAIGTTYYKDFHDRYPPGWPWQPNPNTMPSVPQPSNDKYFQDRKIEELRKEVKALRDLLEHSQKFDKATGQPNCEVDEKVDFIKKLANFVDVDMGEVFDHMKEKEEI